MTLILYIGLPENVIGMAETFLSELDDSEIAPVSTPYHPVVKRIRETAISELTPREAINLMFELKEMARK